MRIRELVVVPVVALYHSGAEALPDGNHSLSSQAPAKYCPSKADHVCYSVGVPPLSASAGYGNIYFQIRAPTSYQWVALGTGTSMKDSHMFVMYQDGAGNVTLSPRISSGYKPPQPYKDDAAVTARLALLAGSGISIDGMVMTANAVCSHCESWEGGHMSFTDPKSSWLGGWKSGGSLGSASYSKHIGIHDGTDVFSFDLTKATISGDENPFMHSHVSNTGTGGSSDGGTGGSSNSKNMFAIISAHGIIMALVMVVLFPMGSMLMPLLRKWLVHAGFQLVGFLAMLVGFALGLVAIKSHEMPNAVTHVILGSVVVFGFVLQPLFGWWHHQHYLRHRSRGIVSYVHIWLGRVLMALGIANGGLGLALMPSMPNSTRIAYIAVAGSMYFVCLIASPIKELCNRKKKDRSRITRGGCSSGSHELSTVPTA